VISVERVDVTGVQAEALVRSVGTDLEACTRLDAEIGWLAGAGVLERLQAFGEVPVGGALVTPGGGLNVDFLVHLVVRSHEEPVSEERIARALRNGLNQMVEWGIRSVALVPLGIGAGNLDAEASARVMCAVLSEHMAESEFPADARIVVQTSYEEEAFGREVERTRTAGREG